MSRFRPPTPWEWSFLSMAAAILLDFLLNLQATFYLVLATMVAVAAVGWAHLTLTVLRMRRWLLDRRRHGVEGKR